jgi:hypothetical protein
MTSSFDTVTEWKEPQALDLSRGDVSAIAVNVAKQLGYEPGAPLEPIVKKLRGSLAYGEDDGGDSDSGSIRIGPDGFTIYIALDTSSLRDRFTIAHELGHFVLHYLYPNQHKGAKIKWLRAQRYGSGQVEYEANWFAAAFLMPTDIFRQKHKEFDGNQLRLADYFKVSSQAVSVRAKSLGLER